MPTSSSTAEAAGYSPSDRVVIEPNERWFRLDFMALWRARDLILLFVHRDFVSKYKQTILGPTWFVVQPILTTGVFMIIQVMGNFGSRDIPLPLFNLCSLLAWQYFANLVTFSGATFAKNAGLFGKVYFPRLAIPVSVAISQLLTLGVQALFFAIVFLAYVAFSDVEEHVRVMWWAVLALPLAILHIAMLGSGFAFITSCLTARYRDLTFLLTFIVQLLLYVSPVIYTLDAVYERLPDSVAWIVYLNPMAPIIELFRFALLGTGGFYSGPYLWSIGVTLVLFFGGAVLFKRTERTFVDTV